YTDPPADSGGGFTNNLPYLKYLIREGKWAEEREQLAAARPFAVAYWYRQSPQPLVPGQFADRFRSHDLQLWMDNPPHDLPGMVRAWVDTRGRLVELVAVPEPSAEGPLRPSGWAALRRAAGLDGPGVLRLNPELAPTPPVYADRTSVWEGAYPERPEIPIRVEAASYRGRPVYFHIAHPTWESLLAPGLAGGARPHSAPRRPAEGLWTAIVAGVFVTLVILAVRNVRRGQGDGRGAVRLAATLVVLGLLVWLIAGGFVADLPLEFTRFMQHLAIALGAACFLAVGYLAL